MGCASDSGVGTVDDKLWGSDERDARESSLQPGRRLRRSMVTGWKETGRMEMGGTELRGKATGAKEKGGSIQERRKREGK